MEISYRLGIKNEYGHFAHFSYPGDLETILERCLDETVYRIKTYSKLNDFQVIEKIYEYRFNGKTDESCEVQKEKIKNLMREEIEEKGKAHAYYKDDYIVFEERKVLGIDLADFTEDELEILCEEIHEELKYRLERE